MSMRQNIRINTKPGLCCIKDQLNHTRTRRVVNMSPQQPITRKHLLTGKMKSIAVAG